MGRPRSGWKIIEQTGVLDNGMEGVAADYLQILLPDSGECLVDDVEVIPAGGANLVPNGTFASAAGWNFLGTHSGSRVEAGALHVRATGHGDTSVNRIGVRLNAAIGIGTTATIRARVKWLCGIPEIQMRLRGSWLEATETP